MMGLKEINKQLKEIEMKVDEAIDAVKAVGEQLEKATREILAKIEALENVLPDDLTEEQQAAIQVLKDKAKALDDIVPDAEPVPAPEVAPAQKSAKDKE